MVTDIFSAPPPDGSHNPPAIPGERKESAWIEGHDQSPVAWLEAEFSRIAQQRMQSLPFYRDGIPVRACGFTLFEQQWLGCLLTPWMLSLLVLPGPGQQWPRRGVSTRLALELPCGSVKFVVGDSDDGQQYLSCSLMSPLDPALGAEQALQLAQQSARMALSLPMRDAEAPDNLGRRALFSRYRSQRDA
ncbi:Hydrogenase-2 operon protein HybE [Dickeya dianthicola]|uniref:Hydrogenase-2 assembly chaperone n=1 Tax=Dickeya dianthicola TaxID=204039 RepID=A0AAP6S181_9GAMM|nr:hydrogenase-2 assembly chaperone [Dickeya dianthicola]ATO33855.1 Hydrogenase-2 operon protein hybE [Dickeya dianthicola RNS04.9]AYC19778.1 Hydrogenase-2 operon protein HybE [Dickeya dianthicola]MBI0436484.1 hydrogenase-2 assembly chaperone [Dickeya dianthicola]MBI0447332.1 hydrogenase-2 assembly chaperone [Dickeya dianthicola]MBI0451707.1 hydrogenase-2 assembly chaperone [Dickeya dianthicola]